MSEKVRSLEPRFVTLHQLSDALVVIDANEIAKVQAVTEISLARPLHDKFEVIRVAESVEQVGEILNGK